MAGMNRKAGTTETVISVLVLVALAAIAAGVIRQQFLVPLRPGRLDRARPGQAGQPRPGEQMGKLPLAGYLPDELVAFGPQEQFGVDDLSDKIDGKAELYLNAGFERLTCQRFAPRGATEQPRQWGEMFAFRMSSFEAAFSVFSSQRREHAEPLALGDFGYATDNALFFVHGRYYVEIIASDASGPMLSAMKQLAGAFTENVESAGGSMPQLELLRVEGMQPHSVVLTMNNAFGFERLDRVFMARYVVDGRVLTGFVSQRASAEQAQQLADAYCRSLALLGAIRVQPNVKLPGLNMVKVYDTYELVFVCRDVLAGVHAAEDQAAAQKLALKLYRKLAEASQ